MTQLLAFIALVDLSFHLCFETAEADKNASGEDLLKVLLINCGFEECNWLLALVENSSDILKMLLLELFFDVGGLNTWINAFDDNSCCLKAFWDVFGHSFLECVAWPFGG